MSRSSRGEKMLVRHPSVPVKCNIKTVHEPRRVHFEESSGSEQVCDTASLCSPQYATVLGLANDADRVRNAKWCLRTKNQAAVKGKNLDFMPDEKLYQDLIVLNVAETRSIKDSKSLINVKCNLKRDPEPDYQSLLGYELSKAFLFSSCSWPPVKRGKNRTTCFDGKSLFENVQIWSRQPLLNDIHSV